MVGPPPVLDDEQNERIESLSLAFAHATKALGVPYIDLFAALCADDAYKREVERNDGAHPRSEGYSKMARIIGSSPSWWFGSPSGPKKLLSYSEYAGWRGRLARSPNG